MLCSCCSEGKFDEAFLWTHEPLRGSGWQLEECGCTHAGPGWHQCKANLDLMQCFAAPTDGQPRCSTGSTLRPTLRWFFGTRGGQPAVSQNDASIRAC